MKYSFFLVAFFLFTGLIAIGQQQSVEPIRFSAMIRTGILFGEQNSRPAEMGVIAGLHTQQWFAGIGAGIDYYGSKRSLPLFVSVQKEIIPKKRNKLFIYGEGGANFPSLKSNQQNNYGINYKSRAGLYYGTGAGYKFFLTKKAAFGLSLGYSVKQHKESFERICDFCQPGKETFDYRFRRLNLRLSYLFL